MRQNTKVMQAAERLIHRNIEQRNAAELILSRAEGNRTGDKELKAIGMKRSRGIALTAFGPSMIAGAFMAMAGIGRDDEERLRRFLPDWQKNSQLLLLNPSFARIPKK